MADDKQTFFLDLDIKEFTEKALSAKGSITDLGSSDNLSGLLEGLMAASATLAAIGLVAFSLKATFDLVFAGEQIQKTNALFDKLSESMGIAGEKLKGDLVSAAGGLASENDILNATNKAMIQMGDNAGRLPEVMALARKATAAFGGDLMERFQQINQAIASGSTRMLRQNGIMLDVTKSVRDYANAQGVSADMLTEAGRKQAIMNAALEYGRDRFKDVDVNQKLAITTSQQFKVSIQEIGEMFTVAFEKIAGPTVRSVMSALADGARMVKNELMSAFGSGPEQATATLEIIKGQIVNVKNEIKQIALLGGEGGWNYKQKVIELNALEAKLREIHSMEDEVERKKASQKVQHSASGESPHVQQELVDHRKLADSRAKFEGEILKLQMENAKRRVEMADSAEQLEKARLDRQEAMGEEHQQQIADLERQWQEKKITSHEQYTEMKKQVDQRYVAEIRKNQAEMAAEEQRMEQNKLRNSQNTMDGIARAAQVSASKANRSLHDFGAQGTMVMDTLKKRGATAFEDFGKSVVDHSQSASEILKGFFLNALADIAQAQGELYLAMGFVDPTKLAAGAALLALSGALRALAGSAGGSSGSVGDVGGGAGASSSSSASSAGDSSSAAAAATTPEQKTVTVQIMGHYFESDQTKTHLMDMLRQVTDATDYKYQQIGSA